ncbi:Epidermin biosynthesis protein like [Actinidia chinensis var. chinensis]|uniref:Epidermin biosynthesis protein like n=1 Tax=Actinidia chinensis var. chinensis TaxID=1590841 RepID=A0A2R6QWE4_ACTCC|nr:Epidermin biosynthesis protein like [Actinidia chinensis var. chinensis]
MFTEGLDQSAINWIKQGSEIEQNQARSPLTEKMDHEFPIPRSPLAFNSSNYTSSHVLPPLKFHSGLLGPRNTVTLSLDSNEEDDDDDDEDDDESVASAPDDSGGNYSEEDSFRYSDVESLEKPIEKCYEKAMSGSNLNKTLNQTTISRHGSTLNKGLLMGNLQIEVPENCRRFTVSGGTCRLRERVRLHNAYGTPISNNVIDLGTPSAPPIIDIGREGNKSEAESEPIEDSGGLTETERSVDDGIHMPKESAHVFRGNKEVSSDWRVQSLKDEHVERENKTVATETEGPALHWPANSFDNSPYYNASGQNAWQTLIAYDACIRLCLNAWARGCTEAPDFLRDECLVLRSAFGLHKLLLQPRGVQPMRREGTASTEQACPLKVKKVVGKIRVEVKKLRLIPRQKLRSTYSQRSALYMQVGAEYVRHVSSLVKTGINSLRIASISVASEEHLSCLFHLKSSTEDAQVEPSSSICLRPGTSDYHVFFPENQSDALLLEVQDIKKAIQGRATIPIASLTENPNDRIRWWPIYHDDQECVGKVQLLIGSTITSDDTAHIKSGPIVETLAYDLLLEAAMRALHFHARNLRIDGPWKWLLTEFADYYGVSDSYTKLRYLSYVMNVATPTKDCLELVYELLEPVIKARSEKSLTRQEKSILLDCETQVENLLETLFENYKSLDENSPTGLADIFGSIPEVAAPALAPAVQLFTLLHDILAQDAQTTLRNYLQTAGAKRCRKHMVETDEFVSSNSEGFLMDSITISTAYLKMKNLCLNISNEIQSDIKIHNQHILPSSIDLSSITAAVYSTELCKRLRGFLAAWPPSSPLSHVIELLIATADFERNLESWNISPVQGGVDSKNLYHNYIMVWVQDMELNLLELCKAEKVPWSGVLTNHSTSPFAEEMYEKIKEMLIEYEVVMNRWPQYSLILENAVANVERAIIKALEKQYSDILTPLKDSIPKRLGMQVQKLTGRQPTVLYSVPSQLGTFLNTIKRILDVLHCKVEDILKSWASYLPVVGDKKALFGEQMNGITVLLRTKYKNYMQATVVKLVNNMQANRNTRLKKILEETKEADGEAEVRERMQMISSPLSDSITNLHEVFTSQIFIATCRGFWDRMGQIVLKFLEGRKENRVWYNGSYYALGILDDTFASQMQRLQGNALQEKDLVPPRSIIEARSILCRDTTNATDTSTYLYF